MLVEKQFFTIDELELECKDILYSPQIAFETYGKLNKNRDNAILICHALTGDSHVAGKYSIDDKKNGWWDSFVGENKAIDTNKFFIISSNVIGGCSGSTGPSSVNPHTNSPYALSFPFITIKDMVKAQNELLKYLNINTLHACIGGSMGGMQVLEWAITFPEKSRAFLILASAAYQSPQNIALHEVGRRAIMSDKNWQNGNYYDNASPAEGLAIARMIAHITYLSDKTMQNKFGRRIKDKKDELNFELYNEFEVESYLNYQGKSFIQRFDANSYLYITRAVDYFDYSGDKLSECLPKGDRRNQKFLVLSFNSDWLYPPYQSLEIVKALQKNNYLATYCQIDSHFGHDAFLLETDKLGRIINSFLSGINKIY